MIARVPPRVIGIGPLPATRKLLEKTGLMIGDIDVIELNEAFASQALAVMRGLGLADDDARVNPHGGALAIGHPPETLGGRRAIATMCTGVGQGIALLIEKL
jgi:acetyl-CoA acetyltransferase